MDATLLKGVVQSLAGGRCAGLNAKRQTPNFKRQTAEGDHLAFGVWRLKFEVWPEAGDVVFPGRHPLR